MGGLFLLLAFAFAFGWTARGAKVGVFARLARKLHRESA